METFNDIVPYIAVLLIGIVGFFLKRAFNQMDEYKDLKTDNKLLSQKVDTQEKTIDELKTTMLKKFTNIHTKQEAQNEINSKIQNTLTQILTKLEILLESKK